MYSYVYHKHTYQHLLNKILTKCMGQFSLLFTVFPLVVHVVWCKRNNFIVWRFVSIHKQVRIHENSQNLHNTEIVLCLNPRTSYQTLQSCDYNITIHLHTVAYAHRYTHSHACTYKQIINSTHFAGILTVNAE